MEGQARGDLRDSGGALANSPAYDRIWDSSSGATAVIGRQSVSVGARRLSVEHVEQTAEAARWLAEQFGAFAYVGLREAGSDVRPPAAARAAMTEAARCYADHLVGAAIIYEGTGFAATIHRSFATAIQLAAKTRFPMKIFGETGVATEWLESQVPAA